MTEAPAGMPTPKPFPLPDSFPIEWPDPEMARSTWQQDRMHMPLPATPMSSWWGHRFARGLTSGLAALSIPMKASTARLNTYFYLSIEPAMPPEKMHEVEAATVAAMQKATGNFWERWEHEWLPEIQQRWDEWNALDLPAMTDAELAAAVDQAGALYERLWHIHFELLVPPMAAASSFQDLYADLFPVHDPLDAYKLLQGADNKSVEAGRKLWELAQEAAAQPALRKIVDETPSDALWEALARSDEGQAFQAKLVEYASFYGRRSDTVQELAYPSWTENPGPILDNLKMYISDPDGPGPLQERLAAERDVAVAEAREGIKNYPEAVRGHFEALLPAAQLFARIQEDHNFWIDQRSLHEVRQLCLEIGRRLAERRQLGDKEDIFLLDMDEALHALDNRGEDMKRLVAERQQEIEHWGKIPAAPFAGTDYGPPPDNPITRALMRFFGGPPPQSTAPNEVRGNPGSPGVATGTARVIMNIGDSGRLQKGDILVTPTTAPPWTPLFATAAAVVTETGGVLSHCAVVAREYGIPAVVGAPGATALIPDGATVEVDGVNGVVRVIG